MPSFPSKITTDTITDFLKDQDVFSTLISICEIPSPGFHERAKVEHLAAKMKALGVSDVHIDETGNAIGSLVNNSSDPKFTLISAHADTACEAPLPIKVQDDGTFLGAHGICDNSAGITAVLILLTFLQEQKISLQHNYLVGFTVGEEGLGAKRGVKGILKTYGKHIQRVINVESHPIGRVTNACMGQYRVKLTISVTQKGGHSYSNFGEPNAVLELAHIIHDFSTLSLPEKITYNFTGIAGGKSINVIPDTAECLFECRSGEQKRIDTVVSRLKKVIKKHSTRKVRCDVAILATTPAASFPAKHPLYVTTQKVQKSMGIKSFLKPGNTDGDVPLAQGIPTLTIGASNGFATHSLDERLEKKSFMKGVEQVLRIILTLDEEWGE